MHLIYIYKEHYNINSVEYAVQAYLLLFVGPHKRIPLRNGMGGGEMFAPYFNCVKLLKI